MEYPNLESTDIKETLDSLGFKLQDRGSFWHTYAVWRNGDNPTAIQIYKDSGVWKDFVEQTSHQPFYRLVAKVLGTKDTKILSKYIKQHGTSVNFEQERDTRVKIKMDKTYPTSTLKKLLPHHKFYLDKGISLKTLRLYQGGYATTGKMNGRYTFAIFQKNEPQHIIGFTGRALRHKAHSYERSPKWKHIGQRRNWLYPLYLPVDERYPFFQNIVHKREVIIVESVGDSLALTQNGFSNHFVTFGLDVSPKQICELVTLNPSKIIISTNNDFHSPSNPGQTAAIKHFLKLSEFFDVSKIFINLPKTNDLCDLHMENDFNSWSDKELDHRKQLEFIIKTLESERGKRIINNPKRLSSKISFLQEYITD